MHACREQGPGLRGSNLWRASQTVRPAAGEPRRPVHQRGVSCEPRRTTPSSGLGSSDPGAFFTAFGAIALRQRACKEGEECISLCSSVCRGSGRVRPHRGARPGLASSGDSQPRGLVGPQSSASCRRMRGSAPGDGCRAGAALCPGAAVVWLWHGCGVASRLGRGSLWHSPRALHSLPGRPAPGPPPQPFSLSLSRCLGHINSNVVTQLMQNVPWPLRWLCFQACLCFRFLSVKTRLQSSF